MIILDTDILGIVQRGGSPEYENLRKVPNLRVDDWTLL